MNHLIDTNLEFRVIDREGDKDYFIETLSYPINLELDVEGMSRIQFPSSRAVLIRTTPMNDWVTVHVLRDSDLYSSFINFEVNLTGKKIKIEKREGYIHMKW